MYYSYHKTAQKRIKEGHLIKYNFVNEYNGISPAMILYFDDHRPMPIRCDKWDIYLQLIENCGYVRS